MHHGDGNRLFGTRHDGLDHLRIAKGGHVALLLQIEAVVGDAVGGVDRQDELQIDHLVGGRGIDRQQQGRQEAHHAPLYPA